MEYQRADRVGDLLAELIAELLSKEVRDPRISAVTVTGVKVTRDLRHARVYFNLLGRQQDRNDVSAALKRATGFIRSKVAKQLNLRFVPTLEFCYDESEDEAQRIDNLLKQLKS